MSEFPRYIVDASVAVKWYLINEELTEPANHVSNDFQHGRVRLLAPDQIRHEVANAIFKSTRHLHRRNRVALAHARRSIEAFLNRGVDLLCWHTSVSPAFDLAANYSCS